MVTMDVAQETCKRRATTWDVSKVVHYTGLSITTYLLDAGKNEEYTADIWKFQYHPTEG
jgi:hypothetical protein